MDGVDDGDDHGDGDDIGALDGDIGFVDRAAAEVGDDIPEHFGQTRGDLLMVL